LEQALTAAASAHLLLKNGDPAGATSRAYYAMFNVARALLWMKAGVEPEASKRHATVLRRFSEQFVKAGHLTPEIGQLLSKAGEARFIADYDEVDIGLEAARVRVEAMDRFIEAAAKLRDKQP
jgi:uncharacterized protein (UPF0332 family)